MGSILVQIMLNMKLLMHRLYAFADMTNQQLIDSGNRMMDETDEAIERSKKVGLSFGSSDFYFFPLDFRSQ